MKFAIKRKGARNFLFTLFASFGVSSNAAPTIELGIEAYGMSARSEQIQSRLAGTQIDGTFESELLPNLSGSVIAGIQLESGSGTSLFNRQFDPRQSPQLKTAQMTWTPMEAIALTAGALDQNDLQTPLLIKNQTFPATRESWQYGDRSFSIGFLAQQSVAADTRSALSPSHALKPYSEFYVEQIRLRLASRRFSAEGALGHFLFNDLQAGAAFSGRFRGNTVSGIGEANSVFLYEYQGIDMELRGLYSFSAYVDASLQVSGLWNYRAPSGKNRGYRIAPGLTFGVSSELQLVPSVEYFFLESDATPALFSDRAIGQTGCRGYALMLGIKLRQSAIDANLAFVQSDVLQSRPYQSGIQWLQLSIRKHYDLL